MSRIALIIVGYLCAVPAFFVAIAVLFGLASVIHPDAKTWTAAGISPVIFVSAPMIGLFVMLAAIMISAIPSAVVIVLAEWRGWRSVWVYVLSAATLAAAVYYQLSPRTIGGLDAIGLVEILIFAASGACAGLTYWSIAGRKSGAWRRRSI